ncbi:MAG: hypothetical protein KIT33_10735 [Candidatus Kapabacteria bacterium]|nr:hypothetical protein [Ignavibacteriota bacterium]MCW5885436.1 hypothetical protein [Candidatus Kapabacteria bacterium]
MKKIIFIIMAVIVSGCYTDTINKLQTFSIQIPIFFNAPFLDRAVPDTSVDFSNLYEYPEYEENRQKISKAEILQINYRIDSLVYGDGTIFNPATDELEFHFIKYSFQFAKPKPGRSIYSFDPNDFEPDPNEPVVILGQYDDVKIADYYREAKRILDIPETTAQVLSEGLKTRPYFYIYTEYSRVKGPNSDEFQLIQANFDVILRLEINL